MATLAEVIAKFGLDFLHNLSEEHPHDNLLFCPLNLTGSIGLLCYGSGGNSAAELEKVLHWDELKKADVVGNRRYLVTRIKTSASPAKFQEKDKIYSSPRLHPEPQAKSWDHRRQPQEPPHGSPTRRPAPEPHHTRPQDERPHHTRPQDERPHHTRPQDERPHHTRPQDERPHHTRPQDERPHHTRPQDERPHHTRPHDERPHHTRPHDERRRGPQRPSMGSEPDAPSCPQRGVPDYECDSPEGVHTAFSKILAELNKPSTNYFLSFANKLAGDYAVPFNQKFLFCALKLYMTEVSRADFHDAPEEMRRLLNLWVEIRSHGEIKDLLPEHSLDCLTQLLLVNTTYFKGLWDIKFDKELTKEVPFYTNEKASHTVQLMHTSGIFNTGIINLNHLEVQILEIPYKNHEMSMFILLPKDESSETLLQLEDTLTHTDLLDCCHDLKPEHVEVAIPKFTMEKTADVEKYLNLSVISDPEKADFSEATTAHGIAMSHVVHDTLFEINEDGAEEPVVKEEQVSSKGQRRGPVLFVADHPFLFYVLHKPTQCLIILGRFCKPE